MKNDSIIGVSAGTIFTVVNLPSSTSILSSFILGVVGAIGAFAITFLLKFITKKFKQYH